MAAQNKTSLREGTTESLRGGTTRQSAESQRNPKPRIPTLRFKEFEGEWKKVNLDTIAIVTSGGTPSRSNSAFWHGNIPWITTSLIDFNIILDSEEYITDKAIQKSSAKLFPKGTILMAMYGQGKTRGKVAVLGIDATTNQACAAIIPNKEIDRAYLFQNLAGRYHEIRELSNEGGQQNLSGGIIKKIKISFSSLPEQQKIAAFLAAVDQKIQQLSKKKALLEDYKKGVMQQLFSGQLRFKDENGNEFPDWEEKRLGELTYKVGKKNKENIQYPIYSINNQEGFRPQAEQFEGLDSNDRGYDISMYKIINSETFAYNPARINVGSIGYSYDLNKVIVSSLYVCFKTKDNLEDLYLLAYLDTYTFHKDILRYEEGGVRQYLFYDNFSHIKIPLPSNQEQQKIATYLSAIDTKIEGVHQQIEKTQGFKKGLLQRMFV